MRQGSYRPDIDGLRAIAILSVVAYHAGLSGIGGGFTGVDVFFVISGFLITQLLCKEAELTGTISILDFYARRIRRLLPALATVLMATLLLGAFLLPPFGEKQELAQSAIASVGFVANHYFLSTVGGYFAGPANLLPLLHLWSLSVEEQFYLIWPVILLLILKFSAPRRRLSYIQIAIAGISLASFVLSVWLVKTKPNTAFFILPSRAWELGMGALLAVTAMRHQLPRPALFGQLCGAVGALLVAIGFFGLNGTAAFPGALACFPVFGAAFLILAGTISPTNFFSRVLALKPMVFVGLASYPWYLWHWPLLSIARARRLSDSNLAQDCGIVLLAFLCAVLTVRFVEAPIRHGWQTGQRRRTVLFAGIGTLAALLCMAGALGAWEKYGPKSRFLTAARNERPQKKCLLNGRNWNGTIFRKACIQVPNDGAGTHPLVFVWGDSFAEAWATSVFELGKTESAEVQEVSCAACPPLLDTTVLVDASPVRHCRDVNSAVIARLTKLREADPNRKMGVVLSGNWPGYLGTRQLPVRSNAVWNYNEKQGSVQDNLDALRDGLKRTLTALEKLNVRTVILLSGPEFRVSPLRCSASGYKPAECDQPWPEVEERRRPVGEVITRTASLFSGVRVVDPISFFCKGNTCPAFREGHPVVFDESHVSVSAAKAYAPVMKNDFRWLFTN